MDGSVETSRPALGPKPRLAPKPFSLQKNSTIRSIHAPRIVTATSRSGNAEALGVPKVPQPTSAPTPPQQTTTAESTLTSLSLDTKDEPKATSKNQQRQDPVPQTTRVRKDSYPTADQKTQQQTAATDEHSPVSHIKDEPKTDSETEEAKNRRVAPVSTVAPAKTDPVLQTIGALKGSPSSTAQKAPPQTSATDEHRPVNEHIADEPKPVRPSPRTQDTPTVAPAKLAPAPQTTPPKESSAVQNEDVIQTTHKAPSAGSKSEQKDSKHEEAKASVIQKPEESEAVSPSAANPEYHWGGARRRLSAKLTSKFESGGPPVCPQPAIPVSTTTSKADVKKPVSSSPEQSQTTPEPSNREGNEGELIDYSGGESIKRRISQLFDSSLRPEAGTKKEEPEIQTSSGGVKERIRNWVMDSSSEAPKPQVVSQTRSKSVDSAASPAGDKTPNMADVQLPAADSPSTQVVSPSTDSPVKQPAETPVETPKEETVEKPLERTADMPGEQEQKSVEPEVVLRPKVATDQAAKGEGETGSSESPQRPLKRNNAKRRSVRFGIVESDDGGPPLILGSPSDSEEEEDPPEDKGEEHTSASVPVYRRGTFLKTNGEIQKKEEEHKNQAELEKRLKVEENKQARLKLEEERKQSEEREKEHARQREEEKKREEEREKQRLKEEEVQRQKEEEQERERLIEEEQKRKRQIEEERERIKQKEQEEKEKERLRKEKEKELEQMKQKEEERARQMEERLRVEEMERERLRKAAEERDRESKRRLEEEEEMKARQRQEEEEKRKRRMELEIRIRQEKEEEKERMRERQREEERKKQLEKERAEELERKMQEDLERKRLKELEEKLEMEEVKKTQESDLISFDYEDVPHKSQTLLSQVPKPAEPSANEVEMIYDDFSVKKPQLDVDFDDFSVKPQRRWGSQAKVETPPVRSWRVEPVVENVAALVDVHPQENKAPDKVVKPDSPEPTPATESPDKEEEEELKPAEQQLVSVDPQEEEEEESIDEVDTTEDESEDEAQVNSYCINPEDEDSDALIDTSPDQQNGVCEQTAQADSPNSVPEDVPEVSPEDVDPSDSSTEPHFLFPESSTPLLDTSVQRSKAALSRRRSRSRPSRSLRVAQTESQTWRVHDSTDEQNGSTKLEDSEPEEKQPKLHKASSPSPALNPAAQLIAQLKRRTAGGGAGKGEVKDEVKPGEEEKHEEGTQTPSPLPRAPRGAAQLAGAALVLPPLGSSDAGAVSSPAWLKELKSKKRLSQYDGET